MISRLLFFLLCTVFLLSTNSCTVKRKEYIERNGLHSDKKPSQIAKEIGDLSKKQKRAYRKELRRTQKGIKKRNKKRVAGEYFDK